MENTLKYLLIMKLLRFLHKSNLEYCFLKNSKNISEKLVKDIKRISKALNNPVDKNDNSHFMELKMIFEKSLAVNKDLKKDHILIFDDLEAKKPKGYEIDASKFEGVIGKRL